MTEHKRAPTERDRQREETHRRVLEAAIDVFKRDGLERASIEDIAQKAGVSRGTFYFHFPTKDDVLLELVREKESALCERIAAMAADAPIEEVIDVLADDFDREWRQHPQLLGDLGVVVMRTTAKGVQQARDAHPVRFLLIPRFQAAMDRGKISALLPAEITTDFFLVNLFGAAVAWVATPVLPLDQVLRTVGRYFLKAARPD
jgi:AcrR family transcriptional regulator